MKTKKKNREMQKEADMKRRKRRTSSLQRKRQPHTHTKKKKKERRCGRSGAQPIMSNIRRAVTAGTSMDTAHGPTTARKTASSFLFIVTSIFHDK